jgi:YidC/Oxa1 family membrane protein insertase
LTLNQTGVSDRQESQEYSMVYYNGEKLTSTLIADQQDPEQVQNAVQWVGVGNRYFLFGMIDQSALSPKAVLYGEGERKGRISLQYPVVASEFELPVKVYFGPKDLTYLTPVDHRLDPAVDFGFFSVVAYPILRALKAIYQVVGNYGIAIIILTILIKILLLPLTYKSAISVKKMSAIQPEIQKLQAKYKDDKESLQREMLVLMRSGGYNPVAGCLPMILQMPVFFALYQVLFSAIELYRAPFFGWIVDLSTKDPYFIFPVLMTVTMYFQSKLTPMPNADPAQVKIMQWMPVIFGAFMLFLPSGLTIYMLTNALTGIIQQKWLNKRLDQKFPAVHVVK